MTAVTEQEIDRVLTTKAVFVSSDPSPSHPIGEAYAYIISNRKIVINNSPNKSITRKTIKKYIISFNQGRQN